MPKIISKKSNVDLDYPVVRPSLDLDFTQEELDPRITFSRGSIGTRVNRNRLIETVAANQPRFDYDPVTGECRGLLIEESRQNLLTYSQGSGMNDPNWSSNSGAVIVQTNSITAPDGTLTANKIIAGTTAVLHLFSSNTFSVTSGTTYTFSCFFKPAESSWVYFRTGGTPFGSNGYIFNISNGTLGVAINTLDSVPIIAKYPDGWYRISITKTSSASGNGLLQIIVPRGNSTTVYTGDGTSGIYVWGAQVETGAFPTSYIPTSGSTVTRSAEIAEMTGTNFSSWYNQTEGTFSFDGTLPFITNDTLNRVPYGVSNGYNFSNSIYVSKTATSLGLSFSIINNNVSQSTGTSLPNMTSSRFKIASSVADKNIYSCGYGGSVNKHSRPSAAIPTVNRLTLGKEPWNLSTLNPMIGCIARFTYYPRALNPNQLQLLTQ